MYYFAPTVFIFLFEIKYLIKFRNKCRLLFNTQYKKKIGCYLNRYYLQTFNFKFFYYYICLLINPSIFYLLTNIFNIVFNSFYRRITFYKKHNRVLTSIINRTQNTEEILSFEENPILNIVYDGAEKKNLNYYVILKQIRK